MTSFLSLFKKKKTTKKSTLQCCSQQYLELQKKLEKQIEDNEKQIEDCNEISIANSVTRQRVAMRALRKKSFLERKLKLLDHTLIRLEHQKETIELAEVNKVALHSVKTANKILKKPKSNREITKSTFMEEIWDQQKTEAEKADSYKDEEDIIFLSQQKNCIQLQINPRDIHTH